MDVKELQAELNRLARSPQGRAASAILDESEQRTTPVVLKYPHTLKWPGLAKL
jgi:hypothetical protein